MTRIIQGSAIRTARQSRGMSVSRLAKPFKMTAKEWKRIEEDSDPCNADFLPRLSMLLHFPEPFFYEKFERLPVLGCRGCCGPLAPGFKEAALQDIQNAIQVFIEEHQPDGFSLLPEIKAMVDREVGRIA